MTHRNTTTTLNARPLLAAFAIFAAGAIIAWLSLVALATYGYFTHTGADATRSGAVALFTLFAPILLTITLEKLLH